MHQSTDHSNCDGNDGGLARTDYRNCNGHGGGHPGGRERRHHDGVRSRGHCARQRDTPAAVDRKERTAVVDVVCEGVGRRDLPGGCAGHASRGGEGVAGRLGENWGAGGRGHRGGRHRGARGDGDGDRHWDANSNRGACRLHYAVGPGGQCTRGCVGDWLKNYFK